MLGYGIGLYFDLQNPYWIILTIIIIMRPSYGLTKNRSKDRVIGTLIGAVIASGLVIYISNIYVYGALGVLCLVLAFSIQEKNYKAAAAFVTLNVIFIYAILEPNISKVSRCGNQQYYLCHLVGSRLHNCHSNQALPLLILLL